jgi:hypothetical protein
VTRPPTSITAMWPGDLFGTRQHGLPPLREYARGKKEVVILFDDMARVTRVAEIVRHVLAELAAAGIGDADPDAVGAFAGLQGERAAFGHGLEGVLDEVDQHLLDLGWINRGDGQLAAQAGVEVQAAVVEFGLEQFEGFLNDVVERGDFELGRCGTNRLQKLRDDVIQPGNFALGHIEVLLQASKVEGRGEPPAPSLPKSL